MIHTTQPTTNLSFSDSDNINSNYDRIFPISEFIISLNSILRILSYFDQYLDDLVPNFEKERKKYPVSTFIVSFSTALLTFAKDDQCISFDS